MISPAQVVLQVVTLLDQLGIRHHIGGSIASARRGTYRATEDVDVVIDIASKDLDGIERAFGPDFYLSRSAMDEALERRSSFNAIHLESGFKVDFFVVGHRPFDREEMRRASPEILFEGSAPVITKSIEDLVLRKLEWYRAGGEASELQWRDVLGLLSVGSSLDDAYLDEWARELGVEDLLSRAREQVRSIG